MDNTTASSQLNTTTIQQDSDQDPTKVLDDAVDAIVDEAMGNDDQTDEVAESNRVAESLSSLQNLIERNADQLDKLREQQKQLRESLKNLFENDAQLAEAEQKATLVTQELKERKQALDNSPEVKQLKLKLSDLKEELKELEETLNNHLISLFQMTGSSSFDTSDGDQREFSVRAKVKPKKAKAA